MTDTKSEFENLSRRSWLNSYTLWLTRDISEPGGNLHTSILLTFVNFLSSSSDSIRLSMRFIGWVLRKLRSFVPANKTICNESPAFLLTKLCARLTQPSRLSPGFISLILGTLPTFIFLGFILCNMESPTNIIFSSL